jgi:hypothetical protein
MRPAVVVLLLAAALAPFALRPDDAPDVWEETLWEARRRGFPYRRTWMRAADGDRAALLEMIRFSRWTDAAGGLGHGVALTELADLLGDEGFAGAVSALSPEERRLARRMLEVGVAYRREWQDPDLTPRLYPLSWSAAASP